MVIRMIQLFYSRSRSIRLHTNREERKQMLRSLWNERREQEIIFEFYRIFLFHIIFTLVIVEVVI